MRPFKSTLLGPACCEKTFAAIEQNSDFGTLPEARVFRESGCLTRLHARNRFPN